MRKGIISYHFFDNFNCIPVNLWYNVEWCERMKCNVWKKEPNQ